MGLRTITQTAKQSVRNHILPYLTTHPGLVITVCLSLLAGWSFLVRPSLPRETDLELHVFRAAELGYSLRAGAIYPRWAPDFYYGYGYPIFNFYAPLTYYLANVASLLIPGGAVFGVKLVMIGGFIAAGVGCYGFVRDRLSPAAGVIAASAFLFTPYIYIIDPHLRGDVAEFLALTLSPVVFWSVDRYRHEPVPKRLILASLLVAALILSHNLVALMMFGLLFAWVSYELATDGRGLDFRRYLPLIMGVLLSAFFWLPVALETNTVQLSNLIGPGHFDFRNHFVSIGELLRPSIPLDLGAANPAFRFNLGIAQWILAGIGSAGALLSPSKRKSSLFWIVITAIMIWLMLPSSAVVWENIPGMAFLQFPWRLLGPVAFSCAILAGHAAEIRLAPQLREWTTGLLVALPILAILPVFVPPMWEQFGPTDQNAILDFELQGIALGTTSTGDFLPISVQHVPQPNEALITSYRTYSELSKVDHQALPDTVSVEVVKHTPISDEFHVTATDPVTLRVLTFMYAGWKATIDGEPVLITPSVPEGFITIDIPQGEHQVRVWLGSTPARTVASLITTFSAIALIGYVVFAPRQKTVPEGNSRDTLQWRRIVIPIVITTIVVIIGAGMGIFQPRSTGIIADPADVALHQFLEGGVDLLGYDLPVRKVQPGDTFSLTLYWKAREPIRANYQVFTHLTTIPRHTWGQSDKLNPGDYPTTRWPLDRYVRDVHNITVPLGTPPGAYTLQIGLWNRDTGVRQLVLAADGEILGDSIAIPLTVEVLPPTDAPDINDLPLSVRNDEFATDNILLIGVELEPGDTFNQRAGVLKANVYWLVEETPREDFTVMMRLLTEDGETALEIHSDPVDGQYPTSHWSGGEIIRDVHSFWIDESVSAGIYTLEIGLIGEDQSEPTIWLDLGTITRAIP